MMYSSLLKKHKENPDFTKKELGIYYSPISEEDLNKKYSIEEINRMKEFLKRVAPLSYYDIYPEEKSEPPDIPNYLKRLNSKPSNRKVGQTFITFTKKPKP